MMGLCLRKVSASMFSISISITFILWGWWPDGHCHQIKITSPMLAGCWHATSRCWSPCWAALGQEEEHLELSRNFSSLGFLVLRICLDKILTGPSSMNFLAVINWSYKDPLGSTKCQMRIRRDSSRLWPGQGGRSTARPRQLSLRRRPVAGTQRLRTRWSLENTKSDILRSNISDHWEDDERPRRWDWPGHDERPHGHHSPGGSRGIQWRGETGVISYEYVTAGIL